MNYLLSDDGKKKQCNVCKKWIEKSNITRHVNRQHPNDPKSSNIVTINQICSSCTEKDIEIDILKKRILDLTEQLEQKSNQVIDMHSKSGCKTKLEIVSNPEENPVKNCLSLGETTRKEYGAMFDSYMKFCVNYNYVQSNPASVDAYIEFAYPSKANNKSKKAFGWGTRKKVRCAVATALKNKYPNFKIAPMARDADYIPKDKKIITHEEYKYLLTNTTDPELKTLFEFLKRTGYRINVAARVRFNDYNWTERCYQLKDRKNIFPLKFVIENITPKKNDNNYIFFNHIRSTRINQFSAIVRKHMKKLITYDPIKESIGAHCFRYAFVRSYQQKNEQNRLENASKLIGQWSKNSITNYNRGANNRLILKTKSLQKRRICYKKPTNSFNGESRPV
jgi:integrase